MFSFDGQIYEQIQGTVMGTKMAPSYANLFMDRFERAFLAQEPIQPLIWKHYIDDILCVWTGSRSELESFLDRLNRTLNSHGALVTSASNSSTLTCSREGGSTPTVS